MKTYEDVINDFFHQLKQIPSNVRGEQLTLIVQKLQTLDLEVAKRILEQLNGNIVQIEEPVLKVDALVPNDYDNLSRLYKSIKQDPTKKTYIDKCQYENYKLLETKALENNNSKDLNVIEKKKEQLININEYFEMDYHIRKWNEYLKSEPLFNQNGQNRLAA